MNKKRIPHFIIAVLIGILMFVYLGSMVTEFTLPKLLPALRSFFNHHSFSVGGSVGGGVIVIVIGIVSLVKKKKKPTV